MMFELIKGLVVPACLIVALSVSNVYGFGFGQNKFEQEVDKEAVSVKLTREVINGGYGVVATAELKAMIDEGKDILIVDTMPYEDSYKKNHIPGATQFLFPIPEMREWDNSQTDGKSMDDFLALLGPDKDKPIIFYCGFVKCTRSHNGALWAVKLGYNKVYRQPGGVFAWIGAEYPVEKVN